MTWQAPLRRNLLRAFAIAALAGLAACAAPLETRPVRFTPGGPESLQPPELAVLAPAPAQPAGGRRRVVEAGSRWVAVGRVDAGIVYKRFGGVFIVQARDVHEAYLVVANGQLVGFYLPVEGTYSPAVPPVTLSLGANQ